MRSSRNPVAAAVADNVDGGAARPRMLAMSLLRTVARRPLDSLGLVVLAVAAGAIVGNALFFQRGPHPAPIMPKAAHATPAVVETTGSLIAAPRPPEAPAVVDPAPAIAPAPASAPVPPRTRAQLLTDIQRELGQRGHYDGAVDGLHGPKMTAAIREFEQAAGLKPTGEPTEALLARIQKSPVKGERRMAAAPPASRADAPASPKRVAAVQRALTDFGYGQIRPTGVLDPATKAAIEKFERERKLPVTGQLSDRLARDLANLTGRPLD